ncbi:MAG: N-acetylglucosamine-6-phosphate deacetylase [Anaerolineae bacterium]
MRCYFNGTVYTPEQVIENGAVLTDDAGRITWVGAGADAPAPEGATRVDAHGKAIIPGLIDLHTFGCKGAQLQKPDDFLESLRAQCRNYFEFGVGGFLISPPVAPDGAAETMSAYLRALAHAITQIAAAPEPNAAQCLGIHLEGPCLDPRVHGAFPLAALQTPSPENYAAWLGAAGGLIKLVTLAPNLPSGVESAAFLRGRGVKVSLGHSAADYAFTAKVLADGNCDLATHMFNAMTPLSHRDPGVAGAVLESNLPVMLICDGIHVHPAAMRLLVKCKGAERIILVTDSMAAAGMGDGIYEFFGQSVSVTAGRATLPSGTLAGSALTLNQAVANMATFTGLPFAAALKMATALPAQMLGLSGMGSLAAGSIGPVFVMDEATGEILNT